jgi:hypothetical protein
MTIADQVVLQVAPGFVEMPHLDDPELLAEKLREVVGAVAAQATEAERESLLTLYRTAYGTLLAEGAIYVGYGYFRTDDGGLSTAALNVFVKDHEEANPHLIVSQTINAHSEGGPAHIPGMAANAVELPCGPAVFVLRMTLAPDDVVAAAPAAWQAQAVIPFPQGKKVVVIDLSTPCPTEAPYYAGILDGIARTVTFTTTDPQPTGPEESRIARTLG